jgi:spermidine/putrescine transport system permease protein
MRKIRLILTISLIILVIPIFSIIILSIHNDNDNILKWYKIISQNEGFMHFSLLTALVSICTASVTIIFSILIALACLNKKQMPLSLLLILVLGFLLPDVLFIGINKIVPSQASYGLNLLFLVLGLAFYCLPYGILILWARFYFINDSVVNAAKDLGLNKFSKTMKYILPLWRVLIFSAITLSAILAFNDYPKTYYLSGSYEFIREFFNGESSPESDKSAYTAGSMTIFITLIGVITLGIYYLKRRRSSE